MTAPQDASPVAELRLQYEVAVADLAGTSARMLAAGDSEEQVARWLVAQRNLLKQRFRSLTPPEWLAVIEARTLARYGNVLGPTVEHLRAQGLSWRDIVAAAARPGAHAQERSSST